MNVRPSQKSRRATSHNNSPKPVHIRARQNKKQENQQTAEKPEKPQCTIWSKKMGEKHFA